MTTHARIRAMLAAGHSYREIRQECNVGDTTIWRVKNGLTTEQIGRPPGSSNTARDAEIVRLAKKMSHAAVGRKFGLSKQRVTQIVGKAKAAVRVESSKGSQVK